MPPSTAGHTLVLKGEKPCHVALHPTLPWAAFCLKHDYWLILHNYHDDSEVFRFPLSVKLEERREELDLQRALGREPPADRPAAKLGEVRSIHFYDNAAIYWNVNTLTARHTTEVGSANVVGHWLLVACELRVVLLSLDAASQALELSAVLLEGRTVACVSPLYSVPVVAVGCSDGFIRLWHYETNVVNPTKLVVPGSKPVTKLLVLHLSDVPEKLSIVGASESGSVVCFEGTNAGSTRPSFGSTWILSKVHETAVVDMSYDFSTGELATLSAAGVAIVINFATGRVMRKVKLGRKTFVPRQLLLCRTERGGTTAQYLLPCRFTKILTAARHLAEASQQDLTEFVSSKKGKEIKIYAGAVHPTIPCLVFCCTNAGCYSFAVAPDWEMPLCAVAYEADSEAPFVDNGIVSARDRVKALVRTLYYVRDTKLHYRVIQPLTDDAWGPARFSDEKESPLNIATVGAGAGPVAVSAAPGGRYLAVVARDAMTVEVRSVKTGQVVNTATIPGDCVVWHSNADIFATSRPDGAARRVAVYEINAQQGRVVQVTAAMDTLLPVRAIFGGRWLGVAYHGEDDHFQFYHWDGRSSVGGLLPQPQDVAWDRSGQLCALVYPKSLAVMRCAAKVCRPLCTLEVAARAVMWWNACLLLDTWRQIIIVFPAEQPCSLVLCSTEVLPCVAELGPPAAPGEEGGGGGAAQRSISPTLARSGSRTGFSSRGSAISAADSKILRAGLDVASVFKRGRGAATEEAEGAALQPTPAPVGQPSRIAKNFVPMRPLGLLTMVDVIDVSLYVMDSDRKLHSVWLGSPNVLWRVLAQTGKVDVALEWQSHPEVCAAAMAEFLAARGHVTEALSLPLPPLHRLRLAVQHRQYAAAHDALVALQGAAPPALAFEALTALGLQCAAADDSALADRCFAAAAESVA